MQCLGHIPTSSEQYFQRIFRQLCNCLPGRLSYLFCHQTERTNQTLEQYLRCFCPSSHDDWSSLLPYAEFAYINSIHTATNQTPFWSNFGFHPSFLPNAIPEIIVLAVQDQKSSIQSNFRKIQETMQKAQDSYKKYYNKGRKGNPAFKIGAEVWLSATNLRLPCPSRKLGPKD